MTRLFLWMSSAVLLLLFFPENALGQNWNRVVEKEGNFSISTTGDFEHQTRQIDNPVFGQLDWHQFTHVDENAQEGDMVFSVTYLDYPEDMVHQDSIELLEEFFLATAESAAYSVAGDLIYSNDIQNFQCPGYTWRIHYNQGEATIRSRAYVCCSRLYILSVAGLSRGQTTDKLFTFFDSFRLIRPCLS